MICVAPVRFTLALLFWCLAIAAPAFSADPVVRAGLQSKGTLYVGQQVLIDVSVLVPNFFMQPPQFPAIDLPDATVTLQDGQALNLNETINGIAYSGIQRTYVVVPQKDGTFTLPPAEITFGYAAVPGQMTEGKASTPSVSFTVAAAPGGTGGEPGVVAAKVTITQELGQDPKTLKAGDTLVRTITVRADGLRSMMIPAPDFTAPQGVRLYRQDPVLSDETNARSQPVAGVRKDIAQYLFSDAGQYSLPAVELSWFDPATAKTESVSAPAVSVTVAAAPAATSDLAPPVPAPEVKPFNWFRAGVIATTALAAALVIWFLARMLSKAQMAWEKRRSDRRQSEAAHFHLVELACQDGSPAEIEKALDNWSRKAGLLPLRQWIVRFASSDTIAAFDDHRNAVYGTAGTKAASAAKLGSGLREARSIWLAGALTHNTTRYGKSLPRLNPGWDRQ